ncbi:MAG: indole-3-glycerol phosphate synthase TrpC [Gemmatimonadales bacterium]|nr:MAG: indole-3-glycerol phosphate synthase TrpC [Gemmatimonadales bacterium]
MNDTRRLTESQVASPSPGPSREPDILDRIVEGKRQEVESLRSRAAEFRERAADAPSPRDFSGALADPAHLSLVAEVKRRSPGAGAIDEALDPVELARRYERGGARALSVLTDGSHFGGSLADLVAVRDAVALPCLRKDFTLEEVQVLEARAGGADAILLIVRILDDARLRGLREMAEELGMAALVEAHDGVEVDRALASGASILGINNRDLATFRTDLSVTFGVLDQIPPELVLVSESGIRSGEDAELLARRGVDAILVGEAMVRAPDPEALARALSGPVPAPRPDGTRPT